MHALIGRLDQRAVREHAVGGNALESRGLERADDAFPREVALAMDRGDARVELAVALREDVEHRGGLAARARVGRGRSAPREQRLARLADALARERRAVREQRVDVEDHEPAWGE